MRTVCFVADESINHPGKWIVRPVLENFKLKYTTGSFNVICARLFSVSYANYLRMCRDCFGAEIIGKNNIYPVAYFKSVNDANKLVNELNNRANLVLEGSGIGK